MGRSLKASTPKHTSCEIEPTVSRGSVGSYIADLRLLDPILHLGHDQIHDRYDHQGEEGGEGEAEDHCPAHGAPEGNVVASDHDVGIQIREEREEVDVDTDRQRDQAQYRGDRREQYRT